VSLFKAFLAPAEIDASVERLASRERIDVRRIGRETIVCMAGDR